MVESWTPNFVRSERLKINITCVCFIGHKNTKTQQNPPTTAAKFSPKILARCPMCRDFTPELTSFLAKNGEKSAVLVSSDFNKADFDQHRGNLPASMLAVPYGTELQDSEFFFLNSF